MLTGEGSPAPSRQGGGDLAGDGSAGGVNHGGSREPAPDLNAARQVELPHRRSPVRSASILWPSAERHLQRFARLKIQREGTHRDLEVDAADASFWPTWSIQPVLRNRLPLDNVEVGAICVVVLRGNHGRLSITK
jgi:hypothetical protein